MENVTVLVVKQPFCFKKSYEKEGIIQYWKHCHVPHQIESEMNPTVMKDPVLSSSHKQTDNYLTVILILG